jgi:hypothetical protein
MPVSDRIVPYTDGQHDDLLKLDKQVTGENREALMTGFTKGTLIYEAQGTVSGFYMPGLGEGPIVATSPEAGIELMKIKYATRDTAVIPEENKTGIDWLIKNGFAQVAYTAVRMFRGASIPWQPKGIFSRIGGNFG